MKHSRDSRDFDAASEAEFLKHECGIFGVFGHPEAARIAYLGLYALQHRGQESAGIVSAHEHRLHSHRAMGMVYDVFKKDTLDSLPGDTAIGHVRYSTAGSSLLKNAQPILVDYAKGPLAVAHNGNLVNARVLRSELEGKGSIFQSTSDSEVIVHLVARSRKHDLPSAFAEALRRVKGAYSILAMDTENLIAARDAYGFRPLCLGILKGAHVVASESCAFDIVDAKYIRDIEPGEMLLINRSGVHSMSIGGTKPARTGLCIFELIYFSRPDSVIFGYDVERVRHALGATLYRENPIEADLVLPVPDSSNAAAIGYSHESGIPFVMGLIRNHYIGRTFIEPSQTIRDFGAKIKYNALKGALRGKRVVVVDDSIVRGTTSRKIVKMIRNAGAKEIHMRISSPPITHPCFYGIDTPTRKELIASSHNLEEIRKYLRVDSLHYLSKEGLIEAAGGDWNKYCIACFSGRYPISLKVDFDKYYLDRKRNPVTINLT
ncbi:MAG: amidophosphoribosyltransferase [Candidatus Abyssobacteria bacterium SURF_5]|uniref:Amidophosphoribosyltransferase n=1 Tax=Abyssobacteria bacterium (strain SURF_5) TaxID=2093360 RepID=A0A3A4PAU6_ABYX5|nr:MAG: amidophosphoribosyltransferase [Candidatus Abyssubacteria bacterium SURF_5]